MHCTKKITIWFVAIVLGWSVCANAANQSLPPDKKLQIYLLMGQSNMAGVARPEKEDQTPHSRVFVLNQSNAWETAVEPLHKRRSKNGGGVSPGLAFAKRLVEKDSDVIVGLVPCAVGGTPLRRWEKGGDLYANAVKRAKIAAKDGTIAGVLYHQGEADSKTNDTAQTYGPRLAKMIGDLRQDLQNTNLPVVVGQIGEFTYTHKDNRFPFARTVNEALLNLPKSVPLTACVRSEGLPHIGDEVHFTAAAEREMGSRYATEMRKLQEKVSRK